MFCFCPRIFMDLMSENKQQIRANKNSGQQKSFIAWFFLKLKSLFSMVFRFSSTFNTHKIMFIVLIVYYYTDILFSYILGLSFRVFFAIFLSFLVFSFILLLYLFHIKRIETHRDTAITVTLHIYLTWRFCLANNIHTHTHQRKLTI